MGVCWVPISVALCTNPGFTVTLNVPPAVRLNLWPMSVLFQSKQWFRSCSFWSTARNQSAEEGDGGPLGCPKESSQTCITSAASIAQANLLNSTAAVSVTAEVSLGWPVQGAFSLWPGRAPAQRHLKQLVQHVKCSTQSKWAWWYSYFYLKLDRSLKVLSVVVCVCSWVLEENILWKNYWCKHCLGMLVSSRFIMHSPCFSVHV